MEEKLEEARMKREVESEEKRRKENQHHEMSIMQMIGNVFSDCS